MNRKAKVLNVAAIMLALGIFSSNLLHAEQDFSRYSNEELVQLRAQVHNMNEIDRARYDHELQVRVRSMNAAERERLGLDKDGQQIQTRESEGIENDNGYGKGFDSRHGVTGGSRSR